MTLDPNSVLVGSVLTLLVRFLVAVLLPAAPARNARLPSQQQLGEGAGHE